MPGVYVESQLFAHIPIATLIEQQLASRSSFMEYIWVHYHFEVKLLIVSGRRIMFTFQKVSHLPAGWFRIIWWILFHEINVDIRQLMYWFRVKIIKQSKKKYCKLAIFTQWQKPMLPGRRFHSTSPAERKSLQFYNDFINPWATAHQLKMIHCFLLIHSQIHNSI